jgi:predicted nuclease with TOPRIM domain
MDRKIKFIVIGLAGFSIVCLFLFVQAASQQQRLDREINDLKTENSSLLNKANKVESELNAARGKIDSLKAERDRGVEELNEMQKKYELASRARDELIQRLKQKSQAQAAVSAPQPAQPQVSPAAQGGEAYWGKLLKEKAELEIKLTALQVDLKNAQIDNESLRRQKSLLEIDVSRLNSENKDILRQLDYNQKLMDSMAGDVVREKNDKAAIQDTVKSLRSENSILIKQLKSLIGRKAVLDRKVQKLQDEKSKAQKRLEETEAVLKDKMARIDNLKNQIDTTIKGESASAVSGGGRASVELPAIVVRSTSSADKSSAQDYDFPGKILAVNLESSFVVIDLGASSGVRVGDDFGIYRDGKLIGSVSVIQTRAGISACDIKKMSSPFQIGDHLQQLGS